MDKKQLATRLLALPLALVLGHGVVRLLDKAWRHLLSPFSRDYGEGCVLAMVQLLHERGTYFTDLRDYPFVHGNYPPVFLLLLWPFHALLGPSILVPRALSLLSTLVLLLGLFLLLRRLTRATRAAATLTGIAVCPWFFQTWAPMGRVDMLALAFSVAGLHLATRGTVGVAFPLFGLAFFTKQNALLAPAAFLLHVAIEGPAARAVKTSAGFVLPLLAVFGALAWATGGLAYRHLVPYTAAAEYEWGRMAFSYVELAKVSWPLLALVGLALLRSPRLFLAGDGRVIFIYWVLNLAAFATIAKAGAAQNYFIEPWLATVLAAAVAGRAGSPERPWRMAGALVAAAVALYSSRAGHRLPAVIRHPERAAEFRELWDTVRASSGPILSDNLAVLVLHDKPVLVEPFGVVLLAQKGMVDPGPLVRDCQRGRFSLIVNEHRLERIPGLADCLATRYEPWKDLATYRLFRPRPALISPAPNH